MILYKKMKENDIMIIMNDENIQRDERKWYDYNERWKYIII